MTVLLLLALLQDPDPKHVDELVKQLPHEDVAVRDAAMKKLVAMGEKILPHLERHAKSEDAEVRSRVAQIAFTLRPWNVAPVAAAATAALKAESKLEDWRPALKALLGKLLDELGDDVAPDSRRDAIKAIAKGFEDGMKVVRENADDQKGAVYLVAKARGTEADRGAMIVCESADFGKIDDSIVICLGDVSIGTKLQRSIIIATGKVTLAGEAKNSVVVCQTFTVGEKLRDCTVVASGECTIALDSKECVYVNTNLKIGGKSEKDRQVEKARLPAAARKD